MILKLFLFLLPLALFSGEVIWNGNVSGGMSQVEYDRVIKEYVDKKYPERVEAWKRQKQKAVQRQKEIKKYTVMLDGLVWQDNKDAKTIIRDWIGAKEYCENLTLVGFNNWRLPNRSELESILDRSRRVPIKKEFKNILSGNYWSSTTFTSDSRAAWFVGFYNNGKGNNAKTTYHYVRCVRAGE